MESSREVAPRSPHFWRQWGPHLDGLQLANTGGPTTEKNWVRWGMTQHAGHMPSTSSSPPSPRTAPRPPAEHSFYARMRSGLSLLDNMNQVFLPVQLCMFYVFKYTAPYFPLFLSLVIICLNSTIGEPHPLLAGVMGQVLLCVGDHWCTPHTAGGSVMEGNAGRSSSRATSRVLECVLQGWVVTEGVPVNPWFRTQAFLECHL